VIFQLRILGNSRTDLLQAVIANSIFYIFVYVLFKFPIYIYVCCFYLFKYISILCRLW